MAGEEPWRMAGEVLNTYIIVEQGDKVLFIDKHAAHERLNFDRMKAEGYQPMVQALLEPVVFTPPAEEGAALLAQLPLLGRFGFEAEDFGGGALMNQGIHGVDLVRYLMGPADSIYALSGTLVRDIEVEDTLTAVVAWHCGAQGVIQASVGDYPGFPRRIELNGESGTIILEEDRIVKWEVAGDSAYHIYEQEPAPEVRSHSEAGAIDPSGHVAQLRNFIDAVRGEGTLLVDEAEGRKALALVLAAYRSAAEGKPVVL